MIDIVQYRMQVLARRCVGWRIVLTNSFFARYDGVRKKTDVVIHHIFNPECIKRRDRQVRFPAKVGVDMITERPRCILKQVM